MKRVGESGASVKGGVGDVPMVALGGLVRKASVVGGGFTHLWRERVQLPPPTCPFRLHSHTNTGYSGQ